MASPPGASPPQASARSASAATTEASGGAARGDRAAALRLITAHLALAVAVGLGAALIFCVALVPAATAATAAGAAVPALQPLWIAVDAALVALALAAVYRLRADLGLRSLGAHKLRTLALFAAISTAAVLITWWLIPDRNGVWLDERNYLETLRRGEILREGALPFSVRWLVPFLAGRWNVLPIDDALALKAVNFAAFAVTGFYLQLLLVRLAVPRALAALAPLFLLSSYLGVYGASNRLVIDAFNYAMFVLLLHTLVSPRHAPLFSALLLLACFNSEKALFFWLPLHAATLLLRLPPRAPATSQTPGAPRRSRALLDIALATLRAGAPAIVYTVALSLYLSPAQTELHTCVDNLHRLAFTDGRLSLKGSCAQDTTFQMLWLPFGPFSVYALLAFPHCPRWLRALPLLLIPVFLQVLAATDTQRMTAYAFIVLLPLGFLYLTRALASLPRALARVFLVALPTLAIAAHYLVPLSRALHLGLPTGMLRLTLAGAEVVLVGALLYLHHVVYAQDRS